MVLNVEMSSVERRMCSPILLHVYVCEKLNQYANIIPVQIRKKRMISYMDDLIVQSKCEQGAAVTDTEISSKSFEFCGSLAIHPYIAVPTIHHHHHLSLSL